MGEVLYQLTEEGRRLVSDGFLRGETMIDQETLQEHLEPIEGEPKADLQALDEAVDDVVAAHKRYDTAMDGALAERVHRCIDVSRRNAAVPGLWHWLAVDRYPHFVRHRWEYRSEEAMREKFLGAGSDLYSNALHRLWWIAELTHEGDDYSVTETAFSNQTIVNKVFDRWFARYKPAVVPVCEVLGDEPSRVAEEATNQFNHTLSSVQLEGLDSQETERLFRDIVEEVV